MYTRASASDWDDFKMKGWTAKGELIWASIHLRNAPLMFLLLRPLASYEEGA